MKLLGTIYDFVLKIKMQYSSVKTYLKKKGS